MSYMFGDRLHTFNQSNVDHCNIQLSVAVLDLLARRAWLLLQVACACHPLGVITLLSSRQRRSAKEAAQA